VVTRSSLFVAALVALALACSTSSTSPPADGGSSTPAGDVVLGGDRPVSYVYVPDTYDGTKPMGLVLVLHGYGAGGRVQEFAIFRMHEIATAKDFIVLAPDGTLDGTGRRFWNATDTCCDFDGKNIDDVAYLTGLVDEAASHYNIDRRRVYAVGHSNGGAMAHRLACDRPEVFAGIATLAAPFWSDASKCQPKAPVAVLMMHGTGDTTVPYEEGDFRGRKLPSATNIAATWAERNGCGATADTSAPPIDLDLAQPAAETTLARYSGCKSPSAVELWTMNGSGHIPSNLAPDFPTRIWSFLEPHVRP
jgi:polyhydroxybutyrate depolymerase